MKTLAIYFSDSKPMGYPFNTHYPYWQIYQRVVKIVQSAGIQVYIVRGKSYLGKGKFSHGWTIENNKMIKSKVNIKTDLIFNRDDKNTIPVIYDCQIINKLKC